MPDHIVDFEEALRIVADVARSLTAGPPEAVPLLDALGRVLAGDILADRDQPAFDRATRDGFAVRAAELTAGPLPVAGQIRAGQDWQGFLAPGAALQIMTGAPLPAGADAVVMVEHVVRDAGTIALASGRALAAGENFVPRAAEARAGAAVVGAGTPVSAAEIAMAANCGCVSLRVFWKPRVAIVATGDELVEVAEMPAAHQIRNSNSYALAALVTAAGGEPVRLPIAPDTLAEIKQRLDEAREADLVLLSGGVSMGEFDLVEQVLAEAGAEFLFTGVRMQPGKPVVFGRFPDGKPFFGLPGNPISTQVTFHVLAEPLLRALAGERDAAPRWAQATLAEAVEPRAGLTRLLPARLDGVEVKLIAWQGSGDLAANARANCYAELLPGCAHPAGEVIRILLR